jgi:hypothetical protein
MKLRSPSRDQDRVTDRVLQHVFGGTRSTHNTAHFIRRLSVDEKRWICQTILEMSSKLRRLVVLWPAKLKTRV